jgi:hypothetical protein
MFYELVVIIPAQNPRWNFWGIPQVELTAIGIRYNLEELMDWPAPYVKNLEKLKIYLKCVTTYLSRGNVEVPLDIWMQDPDEGNLGAERVAILASVENADNSSVGSMIKKSKDLMDAVEFAEQNFFPADSMIKGFNLYNDKMAELNGLANMPFPRPMWFPRLASPRGTPYVKGGQFGPVKRTGQN